MSKFVQRIFRANLIRKVVFMVVGVASYPGLALFNRLRISGAEHLKGLPKERVLFVSNHQTYFADVITFFQIFCAIKWGKKDRLGIPYYLLNPFTRVNYVAAVETMKDNLLSRLFLLAGGITVKRTWRAEGKDVRRGLDPSDTRKIVRALEKNWVITFPQGTTRPFANLSVQFKAPLKIDYDASAEQIMDQIMDAIEQSQAHMLKGKHHRAELAN